VSNALLSWRGKLILDRQKQASEKFDAIRLEVIRNRLTAIADEMGLALQRAAYSTNIKTRLDFSCAIFDRSARVVAQSFSQPIHVGSLFHFVPQIIAEFGADRLKPGDGILSNDGYRGGVHLNDFVLVSPVFHDGGIAAFVATLAHHVDVGGATPGSLAGLSREIFQEGLRVPPVRLLDAGRIEKDLFRLLENNIRSPRETGGDLRAQVAAANIGTRRLNETMIKYGLKTIDQCVEELFDYTERRVREEIVGLPQGVFRAEGFMDNDGLSDDPIKILVTITIADGKVVFDLRGSDPQRKGPVNATYAMTLSNCAYSLRVLMDADLPLNAGFYRTFEVIAPPGTVVNAQHPAAIGGGWETAFRVCETALQAFAKAVPERIAAGSKGCLCNIAFGGISPRSNQYYVFYESMAGGYGGRATKDGIDAIQPHGQNTENSPIEETEVNYPVKITRYELIQDSEGGGRFRGGLGLRRDYCFDHEITFSVLGDRAKFPPWGLCGGQDARPCTYILNPDTNPREFPSKLSVLLEPGDIFSVQMGGGGGYGPASDRQPASVLEDVVAGNISVERAAKVYGVIIDPATQSIDYPGTTAARAAIIARTTVTVSEEDSA
jgi:N-methylhydantoinase B